MRIAPVGDLRLWGGVALLVLSAVIGARLLSATDDTVTVWRAERDLSVGSGPSDLQPVAVSRTLAGDRYARPGEDLSGVLRWPIAAGELLPRAAVAPAAQRQTRLVTIPVDPLHAPVGLRPGDLVDVWSTPSEAAPTTAGSTQTPALVQPAVSVAAVDGDDQGLSGEVGVVLDVPLEAVVDVVAAGRRGVVDLVLVPLASQVPG